MKKLLLGVGTIAAIAAPVACVVSCGLTKSSGPTHINVDTKKVDDGTEIKTITGITSGKLTVSEIDKINHILLIEDLYDDGGNVHGNHATGLGLTTVQGTEKMYTTFGLHWTPSNQKKQGGQHG